MTPPTNRQLAGWLIDSGIAMSDSSLSNRDEGRAGTDYGSVDEESFDLLRQMIVDWALEAGTAIA